LRVYLVAYCAGERLLSVCATFSSFKEANTVKPSSIALERMLLLGSAARQTTEPGMLATNSILLEQQTTQCMDTKGEYLHGTFKEP
jgi:hypothetical protein